jgi:hypothetical protein
VYKGSEVLLKRRVCDFCLPVGLRVVESQHLRSCTYPVAQAFPEVRGKLGASVGDNLIGETLLAPHVFDKGLDHLLHLQCLEGHEPLLLGETVNDHHNMSEGPSVKRRSRQQCNKVDRDAVPVAIRYQQ